MQKKFSWSSPIPQPRNAPAAPAEVPTPCERESKLHSRFRVKTHPIQYVIFGSIALCLLLTVLLFRLTASERMETPAAAEETEIEAEAPAEGGVISHIRELVQRRAVVVPDARVEDERPVGKPAPQPAQQRVLPPARDPERDLFDDDADSVPPPENLPEDVKKADSLLDQGKELLRAWRQNGSRKSIQDSKAALEQAIEAFRQASEKYPGDPYVSSQLGLAKRLHYAAMKSSSF